MRQHEERQPRTIQDGAPMWPISNETNTHRPNVLVVILDDTGWSDFGCFGSEIDTPTINRLADSGLRYTNYHVTPLCSPTRACLLTGRNHHAVGMRFLSDVDTGFPNARGSVDANIETLPNMLSKQGYTCFLVGKWHLTPRHEILPSGPFHNWPLSRGFHKFYGFLDGCTDQYCPELYQDNHQIMRESDRNYHLSEDLADRSIQYISDHVMGRSTEPFYLQFAFGAQHAPFQVPRRYIDKYIEVFSIGWDKIREERLNRQIQMGVAPEDTKLTPRNPEVRPWSELSDDEQTLAIHLQATYAGFLEHADEQLGRVVDELEKLDILKDTLIMVFSDNGASREGGPQGSVNVNGIYGGVHQTVQDELARLYKIGGPDGPAHYPEGWAMAGNTPFRRYKQFVDLGGVRSPLVVSWPSAIRTPGDIRRQFVHVIDLAPTIMDVAAGNQSRDIPFDGKSIVASFTSPTAFEGRDIQYFEMLGHRAIWHRGWRAVTEHVVGSDYDQERWRLYDTTSDFSEYTDLAAVYPERVHELQALWWQEALKYGALPLDDRPLTELLSLRTPRGLLAQRTIRLFPHQGHIPFASGLTGTDRSMRLGARLGPLHGDGVIVASGNSQGGYTLYVKDGRLSFEHHMVGHRGMCSSSAALPTGACSVGFTLIRKENGTAIVELFCEEQVIAETSLTVTSGHLSFWGMDIGRDRLSQVSQSYRGEFPFDEESLIDVTIEYLDDMSLEKLSKMTLGIQ